MCVHVSSTKGTGEECVGGENAISAKFRSVMEKKNMSEGKCITEASVYKVLQKIVNFR